MLVYCVMFLLSEIVAFWASNGSYKSKVMFEISTHFHVLEVKKYKKVILQKYQTFFFWLSMLPFWLVASLRYYVGTDYGVYIRLQIPHVMAKTEYAKRKVELLYRWVIRMGMFMGNVQWVFVLTHLLILFFVWKHLKNYSENLLWSIFVFMFGCSFNCSLNIMRQYIATAICLYALKYIYDRKIVKYVICILVALLFHKTSIIFLFLYFAPNIKLSRWMPMWIVVISIMFGGGIRKIIVTLANFFGYYSNYFGGIFDKNDTQWDFFIFQFIILVVGCYCWEGGMQKYKSLKESDICNGGAVAKYDIQEKVLMVLQMAATISAGLSAIIPNSTRIIMMFSLGQVVYLPLFLRRLKDQKKNYLIISVMLIILYLLMFFRVIIMRKVGETLPYRFVPFLQL